jgi:chromosome segregation ATPase
MAQTPDNFDEIPSIVPERDELHSHRKRTRGTAGSSVSAPVVQEVVSSGTSGFVIFFLTLLFLGMVATGGAGYYFYQESEVAKAELISSNNRIAQLESRLNMVDETTSQSSLGLMEKVEFNFSEVDKLWAARNTLKTEVETLTATVTALKSTTTSLETATTANATALNNLNNQLTTIGNRVEQINQNFSGMDDLGDQLTRINADLNRVKTSMASVESNVEKRLMSAEEDIESINVYRLQINQTLTNVQDSINRLQSRVGP